MEIKGLGLKPKFIGSILAFITILAILSSFFLYSKTYDTLQEELLAKGDVITSKMALQSGPHLYLIGAASSKVELRQIAQEVLREESVEYLIVYNSIGQIVLAGEKQEGKPKVGEDTNQFPRLKNVVLADKEFDDIYFKAMEKKLITTASKLTGAAHDNFAIVKYSPKLFRSEPGPDTGESYKEPYGLVQLGLTTKIISSRVWNIITPSLTGNIILLIIIGTISSIFVNRLLTPLKNIAQISLAISHGDLSSEVEVTRVDEIGILQQAFQDMTIRLRDMIGKVRLAAQNLGETSDQILSLTKEVSEGGKRQTTSTEKSTTLVEQMVVSIREISQGVENLTLSAENNSSSILEMATSIQEVASHTESLSAAVDETSSSIEEMTASIQQVAENVHALSSSMQVTASSINQIDVSIKQVEENAKESSRVSDQVARDAEMGMGSVEKTIDGMNRIQHAVHETENVILSLGGSSKKIGEILDVINDIARQTNLLALNAAIIAAQAGEHGRGFAVVAEEIRDLSERTAASTQEIADLIKGVQKEVERAVEAMEIGTELTVDGVKLANDSGSALKLILTSAQNSNALTQAIAKTTMEQSKGSRHVTEAIDNIRIMVQQIDNATQEQAKGSKLIMKATENMKDNTEQVRKATGEQFHGSKLITKTTEEVKEMTQRIETALKAQDQGSQLILDAVEKIRQIVRQNQWATQEMDLGVKKLLEQGRELEETVTQFNL
ncbi:methyl-accepting chemotaxis protein [candidate division CSSED10-310 bacterium]|uniref:Methyl-accepting chemotaxis protein n=1 Tax=candidate division CSSED10-310 bacterium TaxID=2855610 RepID=A0ABV6YXY6_UNCC1